MLIISAVSGDEGEREGCFWKGPASPAVRRIESEEKTNLRSLCQCLLPTDKHGMTLSANPRSDGQENTACFLYLIPSICSLGPHSPGLAEV